MTDEEYIFRQTAKERKSAGNGAKHKKRGGGRYVRLPSDRLSKKEREALNGEVKTFRKKDFYTWEEFKALPSDLQVAWVNSLINRYDVGLTVISQEILGMSKNTLIQHFKASGDCQYINKPQTGAVAARGKKRLAAAFENWKNTQITMCEEELPANDPDPAEIEENPPKIEALHETAATESEETVAPGSTIAVEDATEAPIKFAAFPTYVGKNEVGNIGALIDALRGSGAKLTIEVTL